MKRILAILMAIPLLAACGEKVEIPPAHVGMVLTKNGFRPDVLPPSKFRLEACFAYCDRLILVEVSDQGMKEEFQLFMPQDQLNMSFDIRFTLSVKDDATSITRLFDRMTAGENGLISALRVYHTYGQPIMREVVRTTMANYSIEEVAANRERINQELTQAVLTAMGPTPLTLSRMSLADVQFPAIITEAKEAAAQRRIEIEREEAQRQVRMVQLETELETARMQRQIRLERAEAARQENEIYAASVTQDYLAYRTLEVLEKLAENGNAVFVPMEALDTLGLQQRIFTRN